MSYHLRLIKGLSYCGIVTATVKNPDVYTEDSNIADKAVNSGYFELVNTDDSEIIDFDDNNIDFNSYTVTELKAYANEHNINVSDCKNKAEYVNAIKEG